MMSDDARLTVASALALTIVVVISALIVFLAAARGGEKMLCHLEPMDPAWHYRTRIPPRPEIKCWYEGERMKPRGELYWAESPKIPPPMVERSEFELRWKGETR